MDITTILIAIVTIVILWIILTYNSMIRLRNETQQAFSGIDVQMKRRSELIPNLVNTVKGYTKHEKELLRYITEVRSYIVNARSDKNVKDLAQANNYLTNALKSLFAVTEKYPNLKANKNFLKLQEELVETEDQIAASRRIYNENATYLNTKIESFPSIVIAKIFNFTQIELFKATGNEKKKVKIQI